MISKADFNTWEFRWIVFNIAWVRIVDSALANKTPVTTFRVQLSDVRFHLKGTICTELSPIANST